MARKGRYCNLWGNGNFETVYRASFKKIVLRVRQSAGKMEKGKTEGRKGEER
jgi:hypothetical protein